MKLDEVDNNNRELAIKALEDETKYKTQLEDSCVALESELQ